MTAIAAHVPAHAWQLPGWATPHNLALIAMVTAAVVVIFMLARAVGRLAGAVGVAAAPAPAPKPAKIGKPLLIGGAAVGGLLLWIRRGHAAAGAKAVQGVPVPVPSPRPTVTVTATPHAPAAHVALPHLTFPVHLTGTGWVVIVVVALLVAYAIVRPLLGRSS